MSYSQARAWHFGVSTYSNYSATIYVYEPGNEEIAERWKEIEVPKFSFGANMFAEYAFSKRLSFSVGLGYVNYGEQTKKWDVNFSFPDQLDPFYGFVKPTENLPPTEVKFIYTTHAVEIPLQVKYSFKSGFYVQGGASALQQFKHTSTFWKKTEDEKATRETRNNTEADLLKLNMAVNAAVGYTFFARSPVNWFIGLNAQHVLFGVMDDVPLNRKYISAGIVTGLRF